jgi:hypothetical protein
VFKPAFTAALQAHCPTAELHDDDEAWLIDVTEHFELRLVNEDSVNSQVAMTNGTFPRIDIELPWWGALDTYDGSDLRMGLDGLVTVDRDEDRVYWGNEIDVRATLTVERFGRRLFGDRRIDVIDAKLRWLGEQSPAFE